MKDSSNTILHRLFESVKKLSNIKYKRNLGALSSTYLENKKFIDPDSHDRFINRVKKNISSLIAVDISEDDLLFEQYSHVLDKIISNMDKLINVIECREIKTVKKKLILMFEIIDVDPLGIRHKDIKLIDVLKLLHWVGIIDVKIMKQLPFEFVVELFDENPELRARFEKLLERRINYK